jgi:hypothetical protein
MGATGSYSGIRGNLRRVPIPSASPNCASRFSCQRAGGNVGVPEAMVESDQALNSSGSSGFVFPKPCLTSRTAEDFELHSDASTRDRGSAESAHALPAGL